MGSSREKASLLYRLWQLGVLPSVMAGLLVMAWIYLARIEWMEPRNVRSCLFIGVALGSLLTLTARTLRGLILGPLGGLICGWVFWLMLDFDFWENFSGNDSVAFLLCWSSFYFGMGLLGGFITPGKLRWGQTLVRSTGSGVAFFLGFLAMELAIVNAFDGHDFLDTVAQFSLFLFVLAAPWFVIFLRNPILEADKHDAKIPARWILISDSKGKEAEISFQQELKHLQIPELLSMLRAKEMPKRIAAAGLLKEATGQDLGLDYYRWLTWWKKNMPPSQRRSIASKES